MVLHDHVVLITGASRGFGQAAAQELAERGHRVVATMRNPDRDGDATRRALGDQIAVTRCDVTDAASVEAARVEAAAADIVELEQPLPLRWPVGDDTLQMLDLRVRPRDPEWDDFLRTRGAIWRTFSARPKARPAR